MKATYAAKLCSAFITHLHDRYACISNIMDNSPTALFDSYEQDFQQIIDSIKEKLDGDVKDAGAGKLVRIFLGIKILFDL